jgi:uncharacterized membrane protein
MGQNAIAARARRALSSFMDVFEMLVHVVMRFAEWTRLVLEALGILTIAWGAGTALRRIGFLTRAHEHVSFTETRFILARYLALALEFQLAADVLETAILPEWTKIGQLAAIAAIRTALNYFLSKEISEEKEELASPAS